MFPGRFPVKEMVKRSHAPHFDFGNVIGGRQIIDRLFARLADVTTAVREYLLELNAFERAVLAKACRGELVPQDNAEEPATALLERIRTERADAAGGVRPSAARQGQGGAADDAGGSRRAGRTARAVSAARAPQLDAVDPGAGLADLAALDACRHAAGRSL